MMAAQAGVPLAASAEASTASPGRPLLRRLVSTLVLLPLFLWVVMAGPPWLFGALLLLVAALGQWEFTGMFERAGVRTSRLMGLAGGVAVTASFVWPLPQGAIFTGVLLALLAASVWRAGHIRTAWQPVAVTAFGICYVNWLVGHGAWLMALDSGREWLLLLVSVTWLGEAAAYLVGSTVGRHPLAPVVSPKKTVEGGVAQLLVSVLAAVGAQAWFFTSLPLGHAVTVGIVLGVVGQVGDLAESVLKRSVGTKDTGGLIPGHGGVLDRIDSLLFNTPVLFYYAAHGRILSP